MSKIKLVIFDLDGTLLDAYPAIIRSFNFTMRRVGAKRQPAIIIRRAVGHGDENLLWPFVKKESLKQALKIYRRHHAKALLEGSRLFPGAEKVLRRLKAKGYLLAVASNRPTRFSRILLKHLKIARYFDFVLCADKLTYRKPHPQILNTIRRRFGVKPQEALYVGDMAIDMQAGRRSRIRTIAVPTGSNTREELLRERPYQLIRKIDGLLDLL